MIGGFAPAALHEVTAVGESTMANPPGTLPLVPISLSSLLWRRFLGLKLQFPRFGQFDRRLRGELKLFIASIYHPVDANEHEEFNDTLSMIVNSVPNSLNFIGGHDVNANLGIRKNYTKV